MRILFFINNLDAGGGTERVCCTLAAAFARGSGHDVAIVSLYGGQTPAFGLPSEVSLYSLFTQIRRFRTIAPAVVWRLRLLVKKLRPDVLVDVNIDSGLCLYSTPALLGTDVIHISWEHLNLNPDAPSRRLARWLAANLCDAVVTLTERGKVSWLATSRRRAHVATIPNPSPYAPSDAPACKADARVVLAAGHLTRRKGFDLLLRAWKGVRPEVRRGWRLRLVGSGEEEKALKSLAASLGIEHSTDFAGRQADMAKEYHGAALFVLPSRAEGLPMVLLEAISFGLPAVAFDCETGPAEIIVDNRTGLLAPPEDVDALAGCMSRMMREHGFRSACAQRALQSAGRYSTPEILEEWEELFRHLHAARRLPPALHPAAGGQVPGGGWGSGRC